MRSALIVLTLVGVFYLSLCIFVFSIQRRLQYHPSFRDSKGEGRDQWKPIYEKGEFLGYRAGPEKPARVAIVLHGNAGEALDRTWYQSLFTDDTLVVLGEYPGFGASAGELSQEAIFRRALEIHDWAEQSYRVPISVVGESLGSGSATYLAVQRTVDRVALISPFSSAADVAKLRFGFLPIAWLMKDPFPSIKYITDVKAPLHIIHGTLDEVIPLSMGRKLFEAYGGESGAFSELPGFGHSNMADGILDSPFADKFRDFLKAP